MECEICYENNDSNAVVCRYECRHWVCLQCHQEFLRSGHKQCPFCRRAISGVRFTQRLLIRSLNGYPDIVINDCGTEATVKELKQFIQEYDGLRADQITLVFGGRELNDATRLTQYRIKPNDILHLILPTRSWGYDNATRERMIKREKKRMAVFRTNASNVDK